MERQKEARKERQRERGKSWLPYSLELNLKIVYFFLHDII